MAVWSRSQRCTIAIRRQAVSRTESTQANGCTAHFHELRWRHQGRSFMHCPDFGVFALIAIGTNTLLVLKFSGGGFR